MLDDFTECNATCGSPGVQLQKYRCERITYSSRDGEVVPINFCAHLGKPEYPRACQGEPCTPAASQGETNANETVDELSNLQLTNDSLETRPEEMWVVKGYVS